MTSKPSVALSRVPSIKQLCELLGFQHASLKDTNIFMEATRQWRKKYMTTANRPAATLLDWNNPLTQADLEETARAFLKNEDNGHRFWSPSRSWAHDSSINFPEQSIEIIALLKQLFWKQNRYAYNNSQYGANYKAADLKHESSKSVSPSLFGHSTSEPSSFGINSTASTQSTLPLEHTNQAPEPTTTETTSLTKRKPPVDVYEILSDSDAQEDAINPRTPKGTRTTKGLAGVTPPSKKKGRKPLLSPRRTERKLKSRLVPGKATDDEVSKALDTDHLSDTQIGDEPKQQSTSANSGQDAQQKDGRKAPKLVFVNSNKRKRGTAQEDKSPETVNNPDQSRETTRKRYSFPFSVSNHETTGTETSDTVNTPPMSGLNLGKTNPSIHSPSSPKSQRSTTQRPSPLRPSPRQPTSKPVEAVAVISKDIATDIDATTSWEDTVLDLSPTISFPPQNSIPDPPLQIDLSAQYWHKMSSGDTISTSIEPSSTRPSHPGDTTSSPDKPALSAGTERHGTEEKRPPDPPEAKPRTKTQIPLWIITRHPRYTEELWHDGKFMGTPLPAFLDGITRVTQRSHIEHLKLTLRTPTVDTKITVFRDSEESWEAAKETFLEKLKEARAEARAAGARAQQQLAFKILIEPFYEEETLSVGGLDDGEDDFDF